ncbi:hypothetical protein GN244_ATG08206 [Phytophthora infestans]|uniref:M96 mating-specific protein family n=1 Tax=Phytophthora infestans TaxID=4787 RepID=A0A833WW24_PHYIN|nr:hypothetical protein GN244_ATG08206 [Phytophthora infestans]
MTTPETSFLVEIDQFLASCDVLTPISASDGGDNDNNTNTSSKRTNLQTSGRLVRIAPRLGRPRGKTLTIQDGDDAVIDMTRELEKVKDRNKRRHYREQRHNERASLQREIEQLTGKLKRSQRHDSLFTSVWKTLSEHQLAARMAAEDEQRRLRKAIDIQSALLQEFHELMNQRVTNSYNTPSAGSYNNKRVCGELDDDAIFSACLDELNGVYAETDAILRMRGLDATAANWDDPKDTWTRDLDRGCFEYEGKITQPFAYRDYCQIRWHAPPLPHRQECRQHYQLLNDSRNTMASKFRITTRLSSGEYASVMQRMVILRHEKEERLALVWLLFTEGEGSLSGIHAQETGWTVATPTTSEDKTGTVMTTCVKNVPMYLGDIAARKLEVKEFEDKLFNWGSENHIEVINGLKSLTLTKIDKLVK